MRTEDILACTTFFETGSKKIEKVHLVGIGEASVPALHAAALEPGLFDSVTLDGGIPSWSEVVRSPRAHDQLVNTVHGVLEYYDLPDLMKRLGTEKLTVTNAKVPTF